MRLGLSRSKRAWAFERGQIWKEDVAKAGQGLLGAVDAERFETGNRKQEREQCRSESYAGLGIEGARFFSVSASVSWF